MLGSKYWRAASLLVAGSMVLAACGTATPQVIKETVVVPQTSVVEATVEVTKEVQVAVTATPEPTAAPTAAPEMKPADTMVVAMQQEPDTLHPFIGSMMAKTYVLYP